MCVLSRGVPFSPPVDADLPSFYRKRSAGQHRSPTTCILTPVSQIFHHFRRQFLSGCSPSLDMTFYLVLSRFYFAPRLIQTALVCIRNDFMAPQEEKGRRKIKKKHLNAFDPECSVCFISSPPLHFLFLFSAPLASYMHSNRHLGEADKPGEQTPAFGRASRRQPAGSPDQAPPSERGG